MGGEEAKTQTVRPHSIGTEKVRLALLALRGSADAGMSTDEILKLTRGECETKPGKKRSS